MDASADPPPSGAFCFLTLISMNTVARGPGSHADGPLGQRRALRCPSLAWPGGKCRCGRWGAGRGGGLPPVPAGQEVQGREKHTIYFPVLLTAGRMLEMGPAEPPQVQKAPHGGLGAPCPSPPPLPFQNLIQCFPVWGAGPSRERPPGGCYPCVLSPPSRTDPHHKGSLRSPVPQTEVPF